MSIPRSASHVPSVSFPRSAHSSNASSATVWWTLEGRSSRITIRCSRGGRRGATCASATSGGALTISSRLNRSSSGGAVAQSSERRARAITHPSLRSLNSESLQCEVDRDRHDHRRRLAIHQRRFELPLFDGLERRLIEQRNRFQDMCL